MITLTVSMTSCNDSEKSKIAEGENNFDSRLAKERQDKIIEEFTTNCAYKYNYYKEMASWQACLDKGLKQDSMIAYLWQQKAMPYFKTKEYARGMDYLDKAVDYNQQRWLDYRGFIKCIFSKNYEGAIADLTRSKELYGNNYVMDHTYDFYIALSHLQLDDFEKAQAIFKSDINDQVGKWGYAYHLDLFYFGIAYWELREFEKAIMQFDKSLEQYPTFSDAQYYKSKCLKSLGLNKEAELLLKTARENYILGNTISEDNIIYEPYPYHVANLEKKPDEN